MKTASDPGRSRDALSAWVFFYEKFEEFVKVNENVLLILVDILVDKPLLKRVPQQLLKELISPMMLKAKKESSITENIKMLFGENHQGELTEI
jgi:hypothetical protein